MIPLSPLLAPTGTLSLVAWEPRDDAAVATLRGDPETMKYLRFMPQTFTLDDAVALRVKENSDPNAIQFSIYSHEKRTPEDHHNEGTFVGQGKLFNRNNIHRSIEVGIVLSPLSQGKGIASMAIYAMLQHVFEDLKFHRACFVTGADNAPMRGWLHGAGATKESEMRDAWADLTTKDTNTFTTAIIYSILEDEWPLTRGNLRRKMGLADL